MDSSFVQDVNFGKRSCHLDLTEPQDKVRFFELLKDADILTSSYRAPALERLGVTEAELNAVRPGLIMVTNTCFGHVGPMAKYGAWLTVLMLRCPRAAHGAARSHGVATQGGSRASP